MDSSPFKGLDPMLVAVSEVFLMKETFFQWNRNKRQPEDSPLIFSNCKWSRHFGYFEVRKCAQFGDLETDLVEFFKVNI